MSGRGRLLVAPALAFVVCCAYWQVLGHDFVNYDDTLYVTENSQVRQGLSRAGLAWAFTATHAGNWHPLTWLSHMADVQVFGLNPAGHHAGNLLLHVANTLVLFLFLLRATGRLGRSLAAALLFGLHPLHVESVAWVAERKDVLSAFFWFLTLGAYLRYAAAPRLTRYLPVLLCCALGLLAKPMLVTLPFVLLLLDYWPLGRVRADGAGFRGGEGPRASPWPLMLEKLPLLALAGVSSIVTYAVQSRGETINSLDRTSLLYNAGNAVLAYGGYLRKMVWPADLAVFYPIDAGAVTAWRVAAVALLLLAVTGVAVRVARRSPSFIVGWFWYLGTLVPVIGLVRVGAQSLADRYTYIPLVGVFIALAWGLHALAAPARWRPLLPVAAAGVLAALALATWLQLRPWRDSISLFGQALARTENNWLAHNNLGEALMRRGAYREALPHLAAAARIRPDFAVASFNEGVAHSSLGDRDLAIESFRRAVRVDPGLAEARFNLSVSYLHAGSGDLALAECRALSRIDREAGRRLLKYIESYRGARGGAPPGPSLFAAPTAGGPLAR